MDANSEAKMRQVIELPFKADNWKSEQNADLVKSIENKPIAIAKPVEVKKAKAKVEVKPTKKSKNK
jgi:hypothetical protein